MPWCTIKSVEAVGVLAGFAIHPWRLWQRFAVGLQDIENVDASEAEDPLHRLLAHRLRSLFFFVQIIIGAMMTMSSSLRY
jgi:hypothetical protein